MISDRFNFLWIGRLFLLIAVENFVFWVIEFFNLLVGRLEAISSSRTHCCLGCLVHVHKLKLWDCLWLQILVICQQWLGIFSIALYADQVGLFVRYLLVSSQSRLQLAVVISVMKFDRVFCQLLWRSRRKFLNVLRGMILRALIATDRVVGHAPEHADVWIQVHVCGLSR